MDNLESLNDFHAATALLSLVTYQCPDGLLALDTLSRHPKGQQQLDRWRILFDQATQDNQSELQAQILDRVLMSIQSQV